MEKDEQGFLYPVIEDAICAKCGLCEKVCQIHNVQGLLQDVPDKCIAFMNNDNIRYKSSSGGFFSALSDVILDQGGVCIGAKYEADYSVKHTLVANGEDRDALRGSKYVQSEIGTTYAKAAAILKNKQSVLFVGTPCQVAGIREYLRLKQVNTELLFTVDIICHGVPSPQVWKDYVALLEEQKKEKLVSFSFRDKERGWHGYHVKTEYSDGKCETDTVINRVFVTLFGMDVMLRPSCYACPYTTKKRCGDLSIGDFWGIEKNAPQMDDNLGVSMVAVNNERGRLLMEMVQSVGTYRIEEIPFSQVSQPNLNRPALKSIRYVFFWRNYKRKGFRWIARHYCGYGKQNVIDKLSSVSCKFPKT